MSETATTPPSLNDAGPRRPSGGSGLKRRCLVAGHYAVEADSIGIPARLGRSVMRRLVPCVLIPPQRRAVPGLSIDQSASAPKPDPSRCVYAQACRRGSVRSRPALLPHVDSWEECPATSTAFPGYV